MFIVHVLTYACWQENKTNEEGNKITNVAAYMSILLQELKHLPFYVLNLSNLLYVTGLPLLNSPSYVDNVILVVTICNQKGLMMFTIYMYMYACTNLWPFWYILSAIINHRIYYNIFNLSVLMSYMYILKIHIARAHSFKVTHPLVVQNAGGWMVNKQTIRSTLKIQIWFLKP